MVQFKLDDAVLARANAVTFHQVDGRGDFGCAGVEFDFGAGLELDIGGWEQGEAAEVPLGWSEVIGDCDDIPPTDGFVIPLGDVERGALAAHYDVALVFVDLNCSYAAFGALREYDDFVANGCPAGDGDAAGDGSIAFYGEGSFDGHSEDAFC